MRVPLLDLRCDPSDYVEVALAVRDGEFVGGSYVDAFEDAWAEQTGAYECVGVNSGTDALMLTLRARAELRAHREYVVVPATSFAATVEAVITAGLRPLVCDVNADGLINLPRLSGVLSDPAYAGRILAVIPVHLYGQVVDVDAIRERREDEDVMILEDACQAHGAYYADGTPVGSKNPTAWSFMPAKILGAWGDGGAVTFPNESMMPLASEVRNLANHGRLSHNVHAVPSFNSRLDNIQAAVLLRRLRRLSDFNAKRAALANRYDADLPHWVRTQKPDTGRVWSYYACWAGDESGRDMIAARLKDRGVSVGVHYPYTLADVYTVFPPGMAVPWAVGELDVGRRLASTTFTLPLWPGMSGGEVDYVVNCVRGLEP